MLIKKRVLHNEAMQWTGILTTELKDFLDSFDVMKFEVLRSVLIIRVTFRKRLEVELGQYIVWFAERRELMVYTPNRFKREFEPLEDEIDSNDNLKKRIDELENKIEKAKRALTMGSTYREREAWNALNEGDE